MIYTLASIQDYGKRISITYANGFNLEAGTVSVQRRILNIVETIRFHYTLLIERLRNWLVGKRAICGAERGLPLTLQIRHV